MKGWFEIRNLKPRALQAPRRAATTFAPADGSPRPAWIGSAGPTLLVFLALLAATTAIAVALRNGQRVALQNEVDTDALSLAHALDDHLDAVLQQLHGFQAQLRGPSRVFADPAARLLADDADVRALAWVGRDGRPIAVAPEHEWPYFKNPPVPDNPWWTDAWDRARYGGHDELAGYRVSPADTQVRCVLPLYDPAASEPDHFAGAVLARFRLDGRAYYAMAPLRNDYHFQLCDGPAVIYALSPGAAPTAQPPAAAPATRSSNSPATAPAEERLAGASTAAEAYQLNGGAAAAAAAAAAAGPGAAPLNFRSGGSLIPAGPPTSRPPAPAPPFATTFDGTRPFTAVRPIHFLGREWSLRLQATDAMIAARLDRTPWRVFEVGAAGSLLLSAMLFQILRDRAGQARQYAQYMRALERLSEIATAISARIDAPRDVLDALAAAARELLGMEAATVMLLDPAATELSIVARAGTARPGAADRYALADLPLCRGVLQSRRPLFLEDLDRPTRGLNTTPARAYGSRVLVLLPLVSGERQIGVMALDHATGPRRFSATERRIAELMANEASVILRNAELYARATNALRSQQQLFEQREALFAVNAAVYQAASLTDSIQMIAELAPGALGVDFCVLWLREPGGGGAADEGGRWRIAAITRPHCPELVGRTTFMHGSNAEVVRATRRMMVVEDARTHPGVNVAVRDALGTGSAAYLPLLSGGGEFIGLLVLARRATGPFAPEQLNLAELFTARAAAAIENAQLLEQTQRDAQAKTVLLRELNHRVKNNLASIISLLSLDEPELSAKARQWLHRAIDRIRTMARAHDLFSAGASRVPLSDLIEQTAVPSLSVVRPPHALVVTELRAAVMLRTDRAVSLAMVLHELCYNAIVHGLGGGAGTVTIRTELSPTTNGATSVGSGKLTIVRTVTIEVADDAAAVRRHRAHAATDALVAVAVAVGGGGGGGGAVTAVAIPGVERVGAGGLGLTLVEGLVTRELDGQFILDRTDDGTVARIRFPVATEDCVG